MERCKLIGTWSHGLIGTHTHSGAVWGSPRIPGNVPGGIQPAGCCCWPGFLLRESQERATGPTAAASCAARAFPGGEQWQRTQLFKLPPGTAGPAAMASRNQSPITQREAGIWDLLTKLPCLMEHSCHSPNQSASRHPQSPALPSPQLQFSALELAN